MTVADVTSQAGDAARGQTRFAGACATCHRGVIPSLGADVGPDLSDIDRKFDRDGLIDAIVNPSAAIALGFGAELFVMKRGEPAIGFLQSDGATVSIRDGYGRVATIPAADVAARVPLKTSLMPDPLALGLTEQHVADITAFLDEGPMTPAAGPKGPRQLGRKRICEFHASETGGLHVQNVRFHAAALLVTRSRSGDFGQEVAGIFPN